MKSLTNLWTVLAADAASEFGIDTARDSETVSRRVEDEGLSFLTITLPSFCSDFERSLADGCVAPDAFRGFHRSRTARGLPAFMRGFLELVFNPDSGVLLGSSSQTAGAVRAVRQLTLLYGKIHVPCSDARVEAALASYVECEQEVSDWENTYTEDMSSDFIRVSLLLWGPMLAEVDREVFECELIPRHGPGATADRLRGNAKFDQFEWTERLETYFPYGEYALPNWRYYYRLEEDVTLLEPGQERPVRVITVPKTLKAPRIIAIEPTCMQYAQQALAQSLIPKIESDHLVGGRTGMIGFTDQNPNQSMAREGSLNGRLATLDLSEASDRVSNRLVQDLMVGKPWLAGAVQSCRSVRADVPGRGVLPLSKFASMGSALTFPIEAMVFLTIVMIGWERANARRITAADIRRLRGSVRVYGDDIIVPVDIVPSVTHALHLYGLKVNVRKSFWTGSFRESCGGDFYSGVDVTPVRVRELFPSCRRDVERVISLVSLRNQLYWAGYWSTAAYLDGLVARSLDFYPNVGTHSRVLGRHSVLGFSLEKWHADLHTPLVKGYVVHAPLPESPVSGEGALLKCLINQGSEPTEPGHLLRYGRPQAVKLKLGWAQPF